LLKRRARVSKVDSGMKNGNTHASGPEAGFDLPLEYSTTPSASGYSTADCRLLTRYYLETYEAVSAAQQIEPIAKAAAQTASQVFSGPVLSRFWGRPLLPPCIDAAGKPSFLSRVIKSCGAVHSWLTGL
jgi:hypothetical protein